MANNKLSDGVGKKIVEALKKQSEIEVNPISSSEDAETELNFGESEEFSMEESNHEIFDTFDTESELDDLASLAQPTEEAFDFGQENESINFAEAAFAQPSASQPQQAFGGYAQPAAQIPDNFVTELDNFEIPSNIAVLKKLIAQLPSGVTRHTGAQIIRQTMEALGISMKSVLQEAQQVQESLSNSAKECQSTIQEYKKQIITLEKQSQNHQKQYSALNELISLFIQTGR